MHEQSTSSVPGHAEETLLLTTKQAAELCNVGERTLWRWSRSGLAPAPIKIGIGPRAAVRYSRAALIEWVTDRCPRTDGRAAGSTAAN